MTALRVPKLWRPWPLYLLILTLPALAFLLLYGLPVTDDGLTHLWRIARIHDSIQEHVLFPRWLPEMLLGFGYPLLNYYASSTYYLVEILHLAGFNLPNAFIVVNCLLVWFAGVGMFLLAKDTYGGQQPWAALVAAVAYAYAPYLFINIYMRGAIAELGAQALYPWIFWSFQRIWRAEEPARYVVIATLALGALAFTHTISLLTIPPLLIIYTLVLARSSNSRKARLGYTLAAMIGAAGITCFFWGPLLFERHFVGNRGFAVAMTKMLPENFHTWGHLVDTHLFFAYLQDIPWSLGLVQASLALVGIFCLGWQMMRGLFYMEGRGRNEEPHPNPPQVGEGTDQGTLPIAVSHSFAEEESRTLRVYDSLPNLVRAGVGSLWFFWLGITALCLFLMLEVSKPLWLSNDIMPIIQFPWRFLAILQLPIALFTAFPLTLVPYRPLQAIGAIALIALLIVVHLPRLIPDYIFDAKNSQFNLAVHAYYDPIRGELQQGGSNNTGLQEFQPRWATESMLLDPATVVDELLSQSAPDRQVSLLSASGYHLQLAIASATPSLLRFASYYFPGWSVILDGTQAQPTYPTTNLGLLTVDLPAGEHTLDVVWKGTSLQFWCGLISQIALALLCLTLLWQRSQRIWLLLLAPMLFFGVAATYEQPQQVPVQSAALASTPSGLEFLGIASPKVEEQGIYLSTYWLATATQPPPIQTRWQIVAESGEVVQEVSATPFYNRYSSQEWAANTVVDDGYWLPLPPALAAGIYRIRITLLNEQTGAEYGSLDAGVISLAQPTEAVEPAYPLDVHFGEEVWLKGYDFTVMEPQLRQQAVASLPEIPIAYPGQTAAYTLYWQTERAINAPYAGFIHLVDPKGKPYVQQDQFPGPLLQPSGLWTPYGTYPDRYLLELPDEMPSGLYIPDVGMYDWRDERRFDVTIPGTEGIFDHYELPPLKVINRALRPAGTEVNARFGELGELLRFEVAGGELNGGELTVQPSGVLTLTTYYKANTPSSTPLTRYVQLRNDQNEILAQHDSEPQEGSNPSWAWMPAEIVADVIPLPLPSEIPGEHYTLYLGWYDAAANFAHLPAFDHQGARLANDEVPLLQVTISQ